MKQSQKILVVACVYYGQIFCQTETSDDTTPDSEYGPTDITLRPTTYDVDVLLGKSSDTVECSADCSPPCTYQWNTTTGPTFKINKAKKGDSGIYICTASNAIGSDSASFKLDVVYAPQYINLTSTHKTVRFGNSTSVTCEADCNPACQYEWTKDSVLVHSKPVFRIENATTQDNGQYICTANNKHGSMSDTFTVTVAERPVIVSFNANPPGPVVYGTNVTLTCQVKSVPVSQLELRNSSNGAVLASKNLTVITHTLVDIQCFRTANFTCEGVNEYFSEAAESSLQMQVLCIPDVPSNLRVTKTTAVSLTVTWDVGWNGGKPQKYFVFVSPEGSNDFTEFSKDDQDYKIDNLSPNRGYTISMYSENMLGRSKTTQATGKTKELPSSIELFKATPMDDVMNVLIAFNKPTSVTRYRIRCCISRTNDDASCSEINDSTNGINHLATNVDYPSGGRSYDVKVTLFDDKDIVQELIQSSLRRIADDNGALISGWVLMVLAAGTAIILGVFLFRLKRTEPMTKEPDGNFKGVNLESTDYEITHTSNTKLTTKASYVNTRKTDDPQQQYCNVELQTDNTEQDYALVARPQEHTNARLTPNSGKSAVKEDSNTCSHNGERGEGQEYENVKFQGNTRNIPDPTKPKKKKVPTATLR